MIDEDDATDGIDRWPDGEMQGKLILEIHRPLESMKFYEFECEDNGMKITYYKMAFRDLKPIFCPNCHAPNYFAAIGQLQEHEMGCAFKFDEIEALGASEKVNENNNKFCWGDPYQTKEAALLHVFDDSKIRKMPQFKELRKIIEKREEQKLKERDPDYRKMPDWKFKKSKVHKAN